MSIKYQVQVFNPVTGFIRTVLDEREFGSNDDMTEWFEEQVELDNNKWAEPFEYRIVADFSPKYSRPEF